jgi:hypothetical protein
LNSNTNHKLIEMAHAHANEPGLYNYRGHHIALEVENHGHQNFHNIPVYMVSVSILPGDIDNPEILFGAGN